MPRIETARLRLRPFQPGDTDALHALFTHPDVRRHLLDDLVVSRAWVAREIRSSARLLAAGDAGLWTVSLPGGGPIGFTGYRHFREPPELQLIYGLHPDHWRRGLATEAARAMIRYGFERCGFDRIVAEADAPNAASLRVMARAGLEPLERREVDRRPSAVYALARTDYRPDDEPYAVIG